MKKRFREKTLWSGGKPWDIKNEKLMNAIPTVFESLFFVGILVVFLGFDRFSTINWIKIIIGNIATGALLGYRDTVPKKIPLIFGAAGIIGALLTLNYGWSG